MIYVYLICLNNNYINLQKITHYFIHLSCVFSFEYFDFQILENISRIWQKKNESPPRNFIIVVNIFIIIIIDFVT